MDSNNSIWILICFLCIAPFKENVCSNCLDLETNEVESTNPTTTVIFSVVLFRHGDRAPEVNEIYKCDPYQSESKWWPDGFGNLLKKGRQRLYTLGRYLRHRYASLLPVSYHFKDINTTSSDIDRCIMSAQCVLAGLYLPQAFDYDRTSDIIAPVIPIHIIDRDNDLYLRFKKECDRYGKELDKQRQDKYIETLNLNMGGVYAYLSKYTCQNINAITEVNRIHQNLICAKAEGYTLPDWAQYSEYPSEQIEYISGLSFYVRAPTDTMKRLAGGPFVTKVIDHMIAKKNKKLDHDYKMLLFAGHDTTVDIILQTLGYDKVVKPDFGSSILFELHYILNQYYVQVYFKPNGALNFLIPIRFQECRLPTQCTLEEFEIVNHPWKLSLDQWTRECSIH